MDDAKTEGIRRLLLQAVELASGGDWQAAHLIAQDHDGNEFANWIHAVCHRMEGDLGNARYWYRRCGRSLDESVATYDELAAIRTALRA